MKLKEIEKWWPLLQAVKNGRTIQTNPAGEWLDVKPDFNVSLDRNIEYYRIKPEPVLRPWKADEVPIGGLIRRKDSTAAGCVILSASGIDDDVHISTINGLGSILLFSALKSARACEWRENYKCQNWLPCGIIEQ